LIRDVPFSIYVGFASLSYFVHVGRLRTVTSLELSPSTGIRISLLADEVTELLHKHLFRDARVQGEELLAVVEVQFGETSNQTATALQYLAVAYIGEQRVEAAEAALVRAVSITERVLGPDHPSHAINLMTLGKLYREMGDWPRSISFSTRAVAILEASHGPSHDSVATAIHELGMAYSMSGDFVSAEPLLRRALELSRRSGGESADVAISLADTLVMRGADQEAADIYAMARAIAQGRALDSPVIAQSLIREADVMVRRAENLPWADVRAPIYGEAEALLRRARAILEATVGADHAYVAIVDDRIAMLMVRTKRSTQAVELGRSALARVERRLGPTHPTTRTLLSNLAMACAAAGHDDDARQMLERALAIEEQHAGTSSRGVAALCHNLVGLEWARGAVARAVEYQRRANAIDEQVLERVLLSSDAAGRRAFAHRLEGGTSATLSLHANGAPTDPAALELALTTQLRRKGRLIESAADVTQVLRAALDDEGRALFERYQAVAAEVNRLVFAGDDLGALARELDNLERELTARSTAFRVATTPVTIEHVQQALGDGAVLVEVALVIPFRASHHGAIEDIWDLQSVRYAAYVVRSDRPPSFAWLGPSKQIDDLAVRLRRAIASRTSDHRRLARELDELLMRPVRELVGESQVLHLSVPGMLNLLPFGVLRDEDDRMLSDRFTCNYLDTGRDLVRFARHALPRSEGVVVAAPAYGEPATRLAPLPGTKQEGAALGAMFPSASLWMGEDATKARLTQLVGPRFLHFATHGYFSKETGRGATRDIVTPAAQPAIAEDDPDTAMFRSGLALATANHDVSTGCINANEFLGLDLVGTRLVVLSACETGLGEASSSDDLYGFRRAITIAGAERQILSLWKVDDEATTKLMLTYYAALRTGTSSAAALCRAQDTLAADPRYAEPWYWAAFIAVGAMHPVDLDEPLAAQLDPPARVSMHPVVPQHVPQAIAESFFLEPEVVARLRLEREREIPAIVEAMHRELFGASRIDFRMKMMMLERHDGRVAIPPALRNELESYGHLLGDTCIGDYFRFHVAQARLLRDLVGMAKLYLRALDDADANPRPPPRASPVDPTTLGPNDVLCTACGGVQRSYYKFCMRCNALLPR
jgi:CHAT domain-containing protein/tetratricopeptide (TPR) repeat protein